MQLIRATYASQELATMLGISARNINARAKREGWAFQLRAGRGGGRVWVVASMPAATRDMLAAALLREDRASACSAAVGTGGATLPALGARKAAPAVISQSSAPAISGTVGTAAPALAHASERERATATARLAFVREVERLASLVGKEKAIQHLVAASRSGHLSPTLLELMGTAAACKRGGTLSRRSLYRWTADYAEGGEAALLPSFRKDEPTPVWFAAFLGCFQRPQHPSVTLAYAEFSAALRKRGETPPSIHAVRRALAKLSIPARETGRATGNALLKLRPHQRRDTSELWPGDVYTADGTTFDAEVLHPGHGQPFKPEITAIIDVATRKCVGLSIALAESKLTVLDALRMACLWAGIPAMLYSDSGPGYVNGLLLDDRTGMMQRLGITPCKAIPGRPQGKGLMERAVKTLWVRAAQGLASYTGALMDSDAAHANFKASRAALKKGKRAGMPTWEECKAHILARVEEYNATPHRGLPRYRDAEGRMVHYSPDEYWQSFVARGFEAVLVPQGMGAEMFMPGERRRCRNGWVQMYGGRYYAAALADHHETAVEVRYDIWDSSRVWCWTLDGQYIGEAELDGNTLPYFAPSRVQAARDKRARAQVGRIDAKLQRVAPGAEIVLPEAGRMELADSTQPVTIDISSAPRVEATARTARASTADAAPVRHLFANTFERYRWLMRHADQQTSADTEFLRAYRLGEEYHDMQELLEIEGIA